MENKHMAMTQNFVRLVTEDTESDFLEFKQYKPDNPIKAEEQEQFSYTIFEGYHGNTLACRTHGIYDLYRVFDKEGNLILETEDVVVELPSWCNPKEIEIKAYDRYGNDKLIQLGYGVCEVELPPREHSRYYNLSVVIPLYNSELFMCRTIDAILSSSLPDIQLILINDGSTDKTYEIARRYGKYYGCVYVVDQKNEGVAITRNRGLKLCDGEYMAFCDNDDIPHPYMYETLFNACKKENSDIAIAQTLIRKLPNEKERYLTCSDREENTVIYSFEEMMENRNTKANIFFVAVWNKIVKTDVAELAQFPTGYTGPGVLYEDVAYTGSLYSYIDKFVYCRDAIYMWDKRKQQTVGTASTWHKACDNEYVWKMFIYGFSYMLYNKSGNHLTWHDYTHFKRLIEAYKKFDTPSPLRTYWDQELKKLINSQGLYDNRLIMEDAELKQVVERLKN